MKFIKKLLITFSCLLLGLCAVGCSNNSYEGKYKMISYEVEGIEYLEEELDKKGVAEYLILNEDGTLTRSTTLNSDETYNTEGTWTVDGIIITGKPLETKFEKDIITTKENVKGEVIKKYKKVK